MNSEKVTITKNDVGIVRVSDLVGRTPGKIAVPVGVKRAELSAVVRRKDGTIENLGVIATSHPTVIQRVKAWVKKHTESFKKE